MGGVSLTQLLIVLVIVALIFGTKKLRNIGSDLGGAVKGFKKGIADDDDDTKELSGEAQNKTAEEEKQSSEK